MAVARDLGVDPHRHIVAVIGDGSLTGGMAYEALNNIGHGGRRVIIVLNDNGRCYAPTVSNLSANSQRPTTIRAVHPSLPDRDHRQAGARRSPTSASTRSTCAGSGGSSSSCAIAAPRRSPRPSWAMDAFKAAVREFLQPPSFFEALGVRYAGPIDGHDIEELETTPCTTRSSCRRTARSSSTS